MARIAAIWKPEWYELDQSLVAGETEDFLLITSESPVKFATGLEKGAFQRAKIISIDNKELGSIVRIDTAGLTYKFYAADGNFIQIEAEETPGKFENGPKDGQYLADNEFFVEIELL